MDPLTSANGLPWTASLHTGDSRMDDTHHEFVEMLNDILATPQDQQLPLYRKFLLHTVEHFAQEERWMVATGFSAENCHAEHHATILETMRAVESHYEAGDTRSSPAWPRRWPSGSRGTPPAWTRAWPST